MHPPFGQQSLGDAGVSLGPRAAPPARREALTVGGLVAATDLAVDPAVAERFLQRLVVREAGRFYRPLLGEDQPDAPWLCVVLAEPDAPGGRIADDQLRRLGGHSVTACQRLFRASAATDPPSRRTLRTNRRSRRPRRAPRSRGSPHVDKRPSSSPITHRVSRPVPTPRVALTNRGSRPILESWTRLRFQHLSSAGSSLPPASSTRSSLPRLSKSRPGPAGAWARSSSSAASFRGRRSPTRSPSSTAES